MYSEKSYQLTEDEYYYLLPVLRIKLLCTTENGKYYFIGTSDDLADMLDRLKGCYDNFDELKGMISYQCFISGSLKPFRDEVRTTPALKGEQ